MDNDHRYEETTQFIHEIIYNLFDLIEEYRDDDDIIAKLRESTGYSADFITEVIKFDSFIQTVPYNKELTHVRVKGESEISAVYEVLGGAYRIQARAIQIARGINERIIPTSQVAEKFYEGHGWYKNKCSCGEEAVIECTMGTCTPTKWWCLECYEKEHNL